MHIEQSNVDSYLVIMRSDVMDDENVIAVSLSEAEHEFTIKELEGDEQIWLLYEPNRMVEGHYKVRAQVLN